MRASTWPALTASPSRTARPCNSPATLALTKAELAALREPEIGTPCESSIAAKVITSLEASSITGSAFDAAVGVGAAWRLASTRIAPPATKSKARAPMIHLLEVFMKA